MTFTTKKLLVRRLREIFSTDEQWWSFRTGPMLPAVWEATAKGLPFGIRRRPCGACSLFVPHPRPSGS